MKAREVIARALWDSQIDGFGPNRQADAILAALAREELAVVDAETLAYLQRFCGMNDLEGRSGFTSDDEAYVQSLVRDLTEADFRSSIAAARKETHHER